MFIDDVRTALVTAGLVPDDTTTDWACFLGYFQDAPDRAVCLYETGGMPPDPKWTLTYPGMQVAVRGQSDDYQAVRDKMAAIFNLLHSGEQFIGTQYVFLQATNSGIIPMGQDEKRRPKVVMNFKALINGVP